jgi:hypothetical protein
MKSILTITLFAFAICHLPFSSAFGQAPATPAPGKATPSPTAPAPVPLTVPVAPPTLISAHAIIAPALLAADLNAVPATPQSLLQMLLTFLPLPAGVTPDKIRSVQIAFTPTGTANITVQYITP